MNHEEAEAEAGRRRTAEPGATWTVIERADGWHVVRIGVAPAPAKGTATKPPPAAPQGDPREGRPNENWGIG